MGKSRKSSKNQRTLLVLGAFALGLLVLCSALFFGSTIWVMNLARTDTATDGSALDAAVGHDWAADSAELTVAASPVMGPVLQELATQFNEQGLQTPDRQPMTVNVEVYEPQRMVSAALDQPPFQAMSPDSGLWLDQLEQSWAAQIGEQSEDTIPIGQSRVSAQTRYAVSPIVIAAWESAARKLGWPDQPVGWEDIQRQATADPDFKWNHPSTANAAGLLATLAEFYAGAGLTRNLTEEAATAPATLDYVQAVESTVRFYGEGEEVLVERLAEEGQDFLDAFVAQERVVVDWNQSRGNNEGLVAIYPAEGTLWTDHPLALLELGAQTEELAVTENQRLAYQAFADYLTSADVQQQLLATGYRPADLDIPLDVPGSPFAADAGPAVDWRQPQTTLQMPGPAVIAVVQNAWRYTKRPTNVYLVVDTSGSMAGNKILRTQDALTAFVAQIQGDRDQVGMIEFGGDLKSFTPIRVMNDDNRADLQTQIDRMDATGDTALVDAVVSAVVDLQNFADAEAINAVVVMTDGKENSSRNSIDQLATLFDEQGVNAPVVFTIAFGEKADEELLTAIAELGGGQFRRADATDIEELYRIISTYF